MPEITIPVEIRDLTVADLDDPHPRPGPRLRGTHGGARQRAPDERLGYAAYGDEAEEWDDDQPDGWVVRYRTMCTMMRKRLS